jgi:hypothetical protein
MCRLNPGPSYEWYRDPGRRHRPLDLRAAFDATPRETLSRRYPKVDDPKVWALKLLASIFYQINEEAIATETPSPVRGSVVFEARHPSELDVDDTRT